ncbi:hypothetical protein OAX78_03520 [Planctomycetota bacterium]|nr:hypothetical protein [Planctomycetota bacterium]
MFPHADMFTKQTAAFTEQWEKAAQTWWDQTLRSPETLNGMGEMLNGLCDAKERGDRAMERLWASYRLPSAVDVERIHERQGELDERLARIEDLLEDLLAAKTAPSKGTQSKAAL